MLYNISCFDFKDYIHSHCVRSKLAEGSLYVGAVCDRCETGSHGDEWLFTAKLVRGWM